MIEQLPASPQYEEVELQPLKPVNALIEKVEQPSTSTATPVPVASTILLAAASANTPGNRRLARARRLPAWYKDYDTDYIGIEDAAAASKNERAPIQLPPGIELDDPNAVHTDIPTEEWNIVVYDDEEEDDEEDEEEELIPEEQDPVELQTQHMLNPNSSMEDIV